MLYSMFNRSEKELKRDEEFVVSVKAEVGKIGMQSALEDYFNERYEKKLGPMSISYDEEMKDWVVTTPDKKVRVEYVESIPKAVQELLLKK